MKSQLRLALRIHSLNLVKGICIIIDKLMEFKGIRLVTVSEFIA